jgi:competence ComEA-like helix-hairpin-helix protein
MQKNSSRKTILSTFAKVQDFFGVTRNELVVVTIILGGLLAGLGLKRFSKEAAVNPAPSEIAHIMDSLASVEASTFTSTTPDAAPVPALAKGDTIRKKTSAFPTVPKKEKITSGKIHLNTATLQDLMRLPGVGAATAEKILAVRQERTFSRIEDVMRVKGIGKKKFEAMMPFLDL